MGVISEISSGAVGGLLGGVGSLIKDVREAWTGEISPDKKAEIEAKLLELENQTMNAQAAINLEEAKSEKWWVAGWRPFIGWICGASLAYAAILCPLMTWVAQVCFGYTGKFPQLDTSITASTLTAMLGIGIMRSYDKKQAPAPAGKE